MLMIDLMLLKNTTQIKNKMREIIDSVLADIAKDSQINFSSQSARDFIAEKLEVALKNHVLMLMEDMACPPSEDRCCEGDCHE